MKTRTETFELKVNSEVMIVKATAFKTPSNETRYRVSVNESPVHIFAVNENLHRFTDIESGAKADVMPVALEKAIGEELYHREAA